MYRRLVSRKHLEILVKYMEKYPVLALSCARSREEVIEARKIWEKIAQSLNKVDEKVYKTGCKWSRYWADWKFKIRRKYICLKKCQSNGVACSVRLSPYEQKVIKILTDEEGNLLSPSALSHISLFQESDGARSKSTNHCGIDDSDDEEHIDSLANNNEEIIHIEYADIKPNLSQDPIELDHDRKSLEELRRDLLKFELKKQRELFEIEKRERREKHELEVSILRLRKQLLMKQIDS